MHALATPLLTKADGRKFGKTESGTVWLDPELTSPYAFHQFFLNAEDAEGDRVPEGVQSPLPGRNRGPGPADRGTTTPPGGAAGPGRRRHGLGALVHRARRRRSPPRRRCSDEATWATWTRPRWPAWWPGWAASTLTAAHDPAVRVEVLERSGVVASQGAARRAIADGGAYVNNQPSPTPRSSSERRPPAARSLRHPAPRAGRRLARSASPD